ncbi:hypothetical protein J6590_108093, partial [Homalodisca vitripennis]
IKFLNNEIEEKKTALKQPITNHHTEIKKQESQSVKKIQARLAEAVEAREKQIADLTEEKAKKRSAISRLVSSSERYDSSKG